MWEEEDQENGDDFDPEKQRKRLESIPVFQKAEEIRELIQRIVDTIDKDNPEAEVQSSLMLEDSMVMAAKIVGAEAVRDYALKMENAVIIKIHARNLLARTSSLLFLELVDREYLRILREEMEAFRLLFVDWVVRFRDSATFDNDGWGLFTDDPM